MSRDTELHKAEGLGSAKAGLSHWVVQRVTAIALIPLGVWMICAFIVYLTAPYEEARLWLTSPWVVSMIIFFIVMMFVHGYLGVQVILEDYISSPPLCWALILAVKFFSVLIALIAIVSILKVFIG